MEKLDLFSISCYCQIRISRFFGFSRVTVIARILKNSCLFGIDLAEQGIFLIFLVGSLIWQNREF